MSFTDFTDRLLAANISTADIADRLGVSRNTVLRARMDPDNPNSRSAPVGWEAKLRELARERGGDLIALSE